MRSEHEIEQDALQSYNKLRDMNVQLLRGEIRELRAAITRIRNYANHVGPAIRAEVVFDMASNALAGETNEFARGDSSSKEE